jgi:site-specific DNA recombinase
VPDYIPPPSSLSPGSTVWAYLRDSGGPSQGESIDRQRQEIQDYCTRYGLRLIRVYSDEARSGGSVTGRDAFDALISASSQPDHAAGLLLWDFARFSRSLDDAGYHKAVLRKNGVVIHSLTDQVPEGPYARVIEVVIDIANEEKRRQVSRDTRSGLRRIVEEYGCMPGIPPYGYKREPVPVGTRRDGTPHILHRWVVDPDQAPAVKLAFELRARGKTFSEIQKLAGISKPANFFTTFFPNSIYKGELWFSGKVHPCEAIVTPELWDAVQIMGELRGRDRYSVHSPRRIHSPYVLSGLAYCQHCGSLLVGYKLIDRPYYICRRAKAKHDCPARNIPGEQLEQGIIDKLLSDVLTLDNMLAMQTVIREAWEKRSETHELSRAARTRELRTVQAKIRNLTAAIAEAGPTRALIDALHHAEQTRDRLELEQAQDVGPGQKPVAPVRMAEIAETLRAKLTSDTADDRRIALRACLQRILVRRDDRELRAVIEYKNPEDDEAPPGSSLVLQDGGPERVRTITLTIRLRRKYRLGER